MTDHDDPIQDDEGRLQDAEETLRELAEPNRAQRRAAGYTGARRVYKLTFEDEDMAVVDGVPLVVRARAVTFRKLLDLARVDTSMFGQDLADLSEEQLELLMGLLADFAGCIVEWNVVDLDGEVIEPSLDALLDQDPSWVMRVFMAWFQAIASVPGPLGPRSPSGAKFPGASVPMAPPSPSPAS